MNIKPFNSIYRKNTWNFEFIVKKEESVIRKYSLNKVLHDSIRRDLLSIIYSDPRIQEMHSNFEKTKVNSQSSYKENSASIPKMKDFPGLEANSNINSSIEDQSIQNCSNLNFSKDKEGSIYSNSESSIDEINLIPKRRDHYSDLKKIIDLLASKKN